MLTVITDAATLAGAQQTFRENYWQQCRNALPAPCPALAAALPLKLPMRRNGIYGTRNKCRTKNAGMVLALVRLSQAKKSRLPQKSISRQKDLKPRPFRRLCAR